MLFTFIALLQGYWIKLENTLSVVWSAVAQQCYVTLAVDGSVSRYHGFELLLFFLVDVTQHAFRGSASKFVCDKINLTHRTSCFCWKPSLTPCLYPAGRCWWKDGLYVDFSAVWRMYSMNVCFHFSSALFLGKSAAIGGLNPAIQIRSA